MPEIFYVLYLVELETKVREDFTKFVCSSSIQRNVGDNNPCLWMLGRQVERGTAGLKLSVTAKPYSIITMKLNTLIPQSPVCLPCPGPANLANKPPVAPATTQPALGNLQAFFRADTTENIAALEKLKIKDFRSQF